MLSGFYELTLACKKYGFSFVLRSESYGFAEIELRNVEEKWKITIRERTYRKLFKRAIRKMKMYNK